MRTMIDRFLEQAGKNPERTAVMDRHGAYTYGRLNRRSAILARHLLDMKREDEEGGKRIAVLLPRSRDFFIAVLGILRAGFAVVPMDSEYPSERIHAILKDAGCFLCISAGGLSSKAADVSVLDLDEALQDEAREDADECLNLSAPDAEGLLLFTSGSTGKPKGVVHCQSIFSYGPDVLKGYHEFTERDVTCCMSGLTFVTSIIDLYAPLTAGGSVYLADETERKNVDMLYKAMTEHGVTGMYLPPKMFEVMRQLYGPLPLAYVALAGEKAQTKYFGDGNLLELYGATEATVVLVHRITEEDPRMLGKSCACAKGYLLSEKGERITEPNVIGEFCVTTPYVAAGYHRMPEETAAKFTDNPFAPGDGCLYHTGDYMTLDEEGNFLFHGRRDRLVKVRGYRVELGEIDNVMLKADGISEAACVLTKVHGGEKLCCYYTRETVYQDSAELLSHAKQFLPEYMVPDYFVCMENLPRNDRNKVDYPALQKLKPPTEEAEYTPPQNAREEQVCSAFADVLELPRVSVSANFFDMGGTSLSATMLIARLKGSGLSFQDITEHPTPRALADYMENIGETGGEKPLMDRDFYPLTKTQLGIYLEASTGGNSATYTLSYLMKAKADVRAEALISAVRKVIAAHPAMKYVIREGAEGVPYMFPAPEAPVEIPVMDGTAENRLTFLAGFLPVVPMTEQLLFHFAVYRTPEGCYLALKSHLIFFDATSISLLIGEINRALGGRELQREDYTIWQAGMREERLALEGVHEKAETYFSDLFRDMDDVPSLQGDLNAPLTPGVSANLRCEPKNLAVSEVKAFCDRCRISESSFFLGAMALLLGKYLGTRQVSFSTVYNGRAMSELAGTFGTLIKRLPVYGDLRENVPVADYLRDMGRQILASMGSDIYSFDEVLKHCPVNEDVEFLYQGDLFTDKMGGEAESRHIEGDAYFMEHYHTGMVTGCLSIQFFSKDGLYNMTVEYRNERFSAEWVRQFAQGLFTICRGLLSCERIGDISLLTETDREMLSSFNDTQVEMDFVPVHEQIRRQARKTPGKKAVTANGESLTYKELDAFSDQAAYALHSEGIRRDALVGVLFEREVRAYVAELAILKAGGAFVPFLPEYPDERIDFCLRDGNISLLLTSKEILGQRPNLAQNCKLLAIEDLLENPAEKVSLPAVQPSHLAYCIYTSGTTGTPKGVMIEHRNIANYVNSNEKSPEIMHYAAPGRVALALASFSFDVSIVEEFVPLCNGCPVVIATEEEIHDPVQLAALIRDNGVNGITSTPTYLLGLLDVPEAREALKQMDFFDIGAEAFPAQLYHRLRELREDSVILNVYGPTEATMGCAAEEMTGADIVTVGRPIANTKFCVLDPFGHELPPGVRGELIICGDQVGRGYVNLPEKTAESFFHHAGMPAYRSGDLAAWTQDGKIRIFGRLDNQIKLRGFRIELDEIEQVMAGYAGITSGAVAVKKNGAAEYLAAYYTSKGEVSAESLQAYMQEKLPEYMLPSVFVRLEAMPMTPGGKVDRKALPEPETERLTAYVEPQTEAEQAVAACMQKALGSDSAIGAIDDFFALGGDSIRAIRLTSFLREQGIFAKAHEIFKLRTVRKIAEACRRDGKAKISQEPFSGQVEDTGIFGLYKHLELPEKHYFNQSTLLKLNTKIGVDTLQKAFDRLTYQHDMLRAVIRDEHLYVRDADTKIGIEAYDLPEDDKENIQALCEKIQSGLSLEESLVRAALIHSGARDLFFITAHHTMIDGVSWRILLADLERALRGERLPQKTNTYRDYALAVKEYRDSYLLEQEIPYWQSVERKLLATETSLCKDYTRHFSMLHVSMGKAETEKFLSARLSAYRLEINDMLLAAVGESYRKTFGKNSLSIQLEGHGREYIGKELVTDRTVGWFTSLYPVVLENISGDPQKDLIEVKETLRRVPNKGVGYNILAFVEGKKPLTFETDRIAKVIFNYLGDVSGEAAGGDFFAPDVEDGFSSGLDYQSEKNCEGSDLAINCLIDGGKFSLWLTYNLDAVGEQEAAAFAEGILSRMELLANHLNSAKGRITASDLGETAWTVEEFDRITREFARRGEHLERIYPLTPMQEGMLLEHVTNPDSPAYRLVDICELNFLPDEAELRLAIDALARKHEVLRTAIIHEGVSLYRQAITDRKLSLTMTDLSDKTDPLAAAKEIRQELLAGAFDLQRKPLMQFVCAKTSEASCYLLIASHHIIVDGWCSHIWMDDFAAFLQEAHDTGRIAFACEGEKGLYEAAVREILAKDQNAAVAHFYKLLSGYENRAEIPAYGTIPAGEQYFDDQIVEIIEPATVKKLEEACRKAGATLADGIELAWGMVMQTACRLDDVVFAKVVSGRDKTAVDVSALVGLFINSVPVRVKTGKDSTAEEMLRELRKQTIESNEFDFCPLAEIQKAAGTNRLVYSILSVENYGGEENPNSPLKSVFFKEEHLGNLGIDVTSRPDGSLRIVFSFDPKRYRETEVRRMISLTCNFMAGIAENLSAPLHSLPLLCAADTDEMLSLSQGEKLDYDGSKTWLDLFLNHAKNTPEKTAVVDSKGGFAYGELDSVSDSIAAYLLEKGVRLGSFVALKMGRVKEFLAAVIAVHKVGAAYVPVDPEYPEERIQYMLEDSEAKAVLTEETAREAMAAFPDAAPVNRAVPEGRAYMIYTSGSTGKPKGVVQRHTSLRAFVAWRLAKFGITEESVHALHASFSFDASLDDMICPIAAGGTIHILSEDLRRDIGGMGDYFAEHHIRMATFSTQLGMAMVNQSPELPLRYLMMGGEKMLPCKRTDIRLINGYGPTEFTVCSSYHVVDQERDADIPIGRPVPNTYSFICDTYGHLLPRGMAGELCLAGSQIAEGYWKQPELTEKSFVACSFLPPGQKMYRTGDLARYNEAGELEYLGRIDNQVKLRGFRIEMGEIETRASQFDGIAQVAAAVKKDQLVLYYTSAGNAPIDAEQLRRFLSETLTEYMVPTVYMPLAAMPMTPNGKIDRKALLEPDISAMTENIPPETEREQIFYEIAAGLLGTKEFGVTDHLVSLGLSSLGVMRLAGEIYRACELRIPVAEILRMPTIRSLAAWSEENASEGRELFSSYPKRELYPIMENQRGILIDWEQNRETTQYNIPTVTAFEGVEGETLVSAVKAALSAHGYLKTRFVYADGDVMQERRDEEEPSVSLTELAKEPDGAFFQSRILPFNLFSDRLYRMEVYTFHHRTWLFTDIHHTVYDGLSRNVFLGEIRRALRGESLKGETLTAYDFALYEKELQGGETYAEAKTYFDGLMEGAAPAALPDSRKPDGKPMGIYDLQIPSGEIRRFCADSGVTAGSFFQAAFGETLRRLTREEKPFYLTIESGRSASPALMDAAGMFVKTLPAVAREAGDRTSKEYVISVHRQMQESYAREFYPYTELVECHGLRGEIMFIYQGGISEDDGVESVRSNAMELELDAVKFPISAEILPAGEGYVLTVEYDGMRYSRADMESFATMVKHAALGLARKAHVKEIGLVSAEEGKTLLELSAGEKLTYNQKETWLDLFQSHAKNTPEKTAVVDSKGAFTYGELDSASNRIAEWLLEKGVRSGSFVALQMGRVKEFLAAVIAVHKVGAAYVPVDPEYPEERIHYMLEDSETHVVLTEETIREAMAKFPDAIPMNRAVPEGRAYMIYTSGSTGKPKGVVQSHRSLRALVAWRMAKFGIAADSVHAEHASFSFDTSLNDLITPLAAGGILHIIPEEMRRDMAGMKDYFAQNHVNGITLSTQIGMAMVNQYPDMPLRYLMMGGEKMLPCKKTKIRLINEYGPTEFTVCASYHVVEQDKEANIPIGRPVPNTYSFICDSYGHLLPQGMAGELCLVGSQIAEGYWKKPELTAKSFVECSFLPGQKMYRTGDLARYNEDGELEYLGRIDTQVKLRGFRIEMGEIENRAAQFAGIEYVAAAVKKEQLVLYYTSKEGTAIDREELRRFLSETLTDYMVPTAYMLLSVMPMTPSGKIDRKALPEPDISLGRAVYEAPVGDMERRLCAAFEQVLGLEAGSVGRNDDFFLLGGSSIKAMLVISGERIEGLSTRTIFKHKTPRRIAEAMSGAAAVDWDGYEKMARAQAVPATSGQISMIDYQFTNVNSVMHNLPGFYRLDGEVDAERLAAAVDQAAKQHPALSTVFDMDAEGTIVQRMVPDVLKKTVVEHVSPAELKALSHSLMQPFHIFRHPLFRARVFRCDDGIYLFMDMHHTISDGVSQGILLEDIARAYRQEELEPDYYYSYVLKEHENQGTEEYKEAKQYFDQLLSGRDWCIIPTPDFDSWGTDAGEESFPGMVSLREMSCAEERLGVSRNILAIAAAMLALREYCQRDEIRIDYINNNRTDAYLQHTVGLVFKIFPVAVDLRDFPALEDFLREVNRQLVEGFAHSICDYGTLDNVALEDALDVNYITNVGDASDLGILNPRELELEASYEATECRVELYLTEEDGQVNLAIEYQKNAYAEGSMKKFLNLYVEKFRQLVKG